MKAAVQVAIQAHRDWERAQLLADKKEAALSQAVKVMALTCKPEDREEYYDASNEIITEFEIKREKAGLV